MKSGISLLLTVILFLCGCAVGNQYLYKPEDVGLPLAIREEALIIGISVADNRPYVLSGKKSPNFVGLQRGGFGNPFDVTTASKQAFADDVLQVLTTMLDRSGYEATIKVVNDSPEALTEKLRASGLNRGIHLSILEWKTDIYVSVTLHFDLTLSIVDQDGKILAQSTQQGEEALGGHVMSQESTGGKASASLSTKLSYLFTDPDIQAALADGSG